MKLTIEGKKNPGSLEWDWGLTCDCGYSSWHITGMNWDHTALVAQIHYELGCNEHAEKVEETREKYKAKHSKPRPYSGGVTTAEVAANIPRVFPQLQKVAFGTQEHAKAPLELQVVA